MHWQKCKSKSDAAMARIRDFGCNSYGFNINMCGRLYKMFVQPSMEYGLALCHKKKDLKIPVKGFNQKMKSIFGVRNGVNPEVLRIWVNVNSPILRQKKLALNFYKRFEKMSCDQFVIKKRKFTMITMNTEGKEQLIRAFTSLKEII